MSSSSPAPAARIIGASAVFQQLLHQIRRIAPSRQAILITGPTGAGKEVLAQLIHQHGADPEAPFVDLNCSAIPEHLVEAELFGHVKGAFTGAHSHRRGHLEMAGNGTLFLDEIGELPLALQAKLLRVLETRRFRPVGASDNRPFNGRIVAATHRDLPVLITQGHFREDLYYRLSVFILTLPGLSQRKEDIAALAEHFAALQPQPLHFSTDAIARLQQHHWPGNVRELRNLIDRLALLADSPCISADVLRAFLPANTSIVPAAQHHEQLADALLALPGNDKLLAAEQLLLARALHCCAGNKAAAARLLGISRKAVERRLQRDDDRPQAARQCLAAARLLLQHADFKGASAQLAQGLALLQAQPDEPEQQQLCYALHRLQAICQQSLHGWQNAAASASHDAAMALARQLGDDEALSALLFWRWTSQLMRLELRQARATAQEMQLRAQGSNDAGIRNQAQIALSNTLFWLGDSEQALHCLEHSELLLPAATPCRHDLDLHALALMLEGLAAFQSGAFRRARQAWERLCRHSDDDTRPPLHRAIALQGAAWLACLFGDEARLGQLAQALENVACAHGLSFFLGMGRILHGCHLACRQQYQQAEQQMHDGYHNHLQHGGGKLFHSFQAWRRGDALLQAGRARDCDTVVTHALELAIAHQERAYLGELLTLKACALLACGDHEGAEQGLRGAIATAIAIGAVPAHIHAAEQLARLQLAAQRQPEALKTLSKALHDVEQDAMPPGLHSALLLLLALSGADCPPLTQGVIYGL